MACTTMMKSWLRSQDSIVGAPVYLDVRMYLDMVMAWEPLGIWMSMLTVVGGLWW